MAMQVEVGSALTSIANLSELTRGAKLQCAFTGALSDVNSQPGELSGSSAPLVLGGGTSPSGRLLRPASMPAATSRPRLAPRPFSREKSSDTFAAVKPPVPSHASPKPPMLTQTFEDTAAAKESTGNAPLLVDQWLIESKSPGDLDTNVPFYSSPQDNTVILFKTGGAEKTRGRLTPENSPTSSPQTFSILQAQEGQLPPSTPMVSYGRPESAGIYRQLSFSSESRPVSWHPCRSVEKKDTFTGIAKEKAKQGPKECADTVSLADVVQLRRKERPASVVFQESLKYQSHGGSEVSDEKSFPRKLWLRKPRPLSMDLTAKFEKRDLSLQTKACLFESKEEGLALPLADVSCGQPSDLRGASRADSSTPNRKSNVAVADFHGVQSKTALPHQTLSPSKASPLCQDSPKRLVLGCSRNRKDLWEPRLRSQDDQTDRDTTASENSQELHPDSKGQSVNERAAFSPKEACAVSQSAEGEKPSVQGGSVKESVPLLAGPGNMAAPVDDEPFPESSRKESRILSLQQRIKELTAENLEGKSGKPRQSSRSQPLSADLTKVFSSPVDASKAKTDRLSDLHWKPLNEMRESQKNEADLRCGANGKEADEAGTALKPQQLTKTPWVEGPIEREGGLARERRNTALKGERPASGVDQEAKTNPMFPTEKARSRTVRATMFEHLVQRHSIVTDHHGTEPPLQSVGELCVDWLGHSRELLLEAKVVSKQAPSSQTDRLAEAEKHGKTQSPDEDRTLKSPTAEKCTTAEKGQTAALEHVVDSFRCKRIEPRYEILQTVGERAQSEAVAVVPEDKAVTLRRGRSLKAKSPVEASWPPRLEGREVDLGSKKESMAGTDTRPTTFNERVLSRDRLAFHEQLTDLAKNETRQTPVSVKPSAFANRGLGLRGDKVPEPYSEMGRGKRGVRHAEMTEGPKVWKCLPESFGVGPDQTDGREAHATVGQRTSPDSHFSVRGPTQWQNPSSVDAGACRQEESFRKGPAAYCVPGPLDIGSRRPAGDGLYSPAVIEKLAGSRWNASILKASERQRRKTLPVGEAGAMAHEHAEVLSRRDSLQLHQGSVAQKSRQAQGSMKLTEESSVFSSSPDERLKNPLLSPTATYFAVTCQIPDENEHCSGTTADAQKSRPIALMVENARAGAPRRSQPICHQSGQKSSAAPRSLDRNRDGEAEGVDNSGHSKKGAWKSPPAEPREESLQLRGKRPAEAKERGSSSACEPKPPLYSRPSRPDSKHPGEMPCGDRGQSVAQMRVAESYNASVLDIDALMADYEDEIRKASAQESSLLPQEKLTRERSPAGNRASAGCNWKDPNPSEASTGSTRLGIYATEFHGPERERSSSLEPSPLKLGAGKLCPPAWGKPAAEKTKYCLPDPISSRKKTFIVDDELGEAPLPKQQDSKSVPCHVQAVPSLAMEAEPESTFVPRSSQEPAHGALRKEGSPKQQVAGAPQEDDRQQDLDVRSANKRKSSPNGRSPERNSSATQSRARWSSFAPGLGDTLPNLRRSYSEKINQTGVRRGSPLRLGASDSREQHKIPQNVLLESKESWLKKRSVSQQDAVVHEGKRDLKKEWAATDLDSSEPRRPPRLPGQRRSRSFYKDRRVDHRPMDRLKQCFGRPAAEAKDTDNLVQETDSQYGTWSEQRHSGDSLVPDSPSSEKSSGPSTRKQAASSRLSSFSSQTDPASTTDPPESSRDLRSASLDCSSTDKDSADGVGGPVPANTCPDFSFVGQTPVLDSSALKTRVQLSKRRRQHRAPISHSLRRSSGGDSEQQLSVTVEADSPWMFKDSTETSAKQEDADEEAKLYPLQRSPISQLQTLPLFPRMDHSALKAQLRKRQELEGPAEAARPEELTKSPRSAFPSGVPSSRRLLPGTGQEERSEEVSPQWLKELKSKKRLSQHENQV